MVIAIHTTVVADLLNCCRSGTELRSPLLTQCSMVRKNGGSR